MLFEKKKGDAGSLSGKVTVYALIELEDSELEKSDLHDLVQNGILAVIGDFSKYYDIKEFLKKELGINFEKGVQEFFARISGEDPLLGSLNNDKFQHKLKSLKNIEDFIPTPVQPEIFSSEAEIMAREGDVYCVGRFTNINNANIAVNAFAILYQMHYREQQRKLVKLEVEAILQEVSKTVENSPHEEVKNFKELKEGLELHLQTRFIPELLYYSHEPETRERSFQKFRKFMEGYKFTQDIENIIQCIGNEQIDEKRKSSIVELYIKKICALVQEDFVKLTQICKDLEKEGIV